MKTLGLPLAFLSFAAVAMAAEYHVAMTGTDTASGEPAAPLKTIGAAAQKAMPGDTVTVHTGVYREWVNPPRGGESDTKRIVYRSAPGEKVVITGSEAIKGWEQVSGDTWKLIVPNARFGDFNPYSDNIHGDWLSRGGDRHTGAVYLEGNSLYEAGEPAKVMKPVGDRPLWSGTVGKDSTVILAQFKGLDPNLARVEINVRRSVFYPARPGVNYLTVRGFTMENAATPWAPPTAEQIGLIGTHWSKGWVIENNIIRHSKCVGITLGKYGDNRDNRSESEEGYVATIGRAIRAGWNAENIGHHLVRNNEISFCEQAGIVGSLGAAFSTLSGNDIHDIHIMDEFWGYEIAGIKLHGAVDVEISRNHIHNTEGGIWLDWMLQGTRITGNFLHHNRIQDLSFEVDHGPVTVDNNLFLSDSQAQVSLSQGCAFAHNLINWTVWPMHSPDGRRTPFLKPHDTAIAGRHDNPCGDTRFFNNIFLRTDLRPYDKSVLPVRMEGNVFLKGATPSKFEAAPVVGNADPKISIIEKADGWYLDIAENEKWKGMTPRSLVTTALLGKAVIPDQAFENPDGSPLVVNTDYFGKKRDASNPFPGPFETPVNGEIKVWPKR